MPSHLLARIFAYVPCAGGEPCGCSSDTLDVCIASGENLCGKYAVAKDANGCPTCEWQRKLLLVGTASVRDALRFVRRRRPRSLCHASERMKDDKHVVTTAIENFGDNCMITAPTFIFIINCISPRLLRDDGVIKAIRDSYAKHTKYTVVKRFIANHIIHISEPRTGRYDIRERVRLENLKARWEQHVTHPCYGSTYYRHKTTTKHVIEIFTKYLKEPPCKFDSGYWRDLGWPNYIWICQPTPHHSVLRDMG